MKKKLKKKKTVSERPVAALVIVRDNEIDEFQIIRCASVKVAKEFAACSIAEGGPGTEAYVYGLLSKGKK